MSSLALMGTVSVSILELVRTSQILQLGDLHQPKSNELLIPAICL